jgi:REP element-mobilizing transposase RayT
MPSHLRFQSQKWATHHVVSRCLQGFAFLKPTREIRAITKGVLGYALNKYEKVIQLHHYVFLSNHFHLIVSAETRQDLAHFMCFLKGNLARELARIHDWHDTLWQKRYSSEEILDDAGLREVFKYLTQNSVKEGLVDHPKDWKGLHGYHQLVMKKSVSGPWVNRTGYYWAKQRREEVTLDDFTTEYEIKLTQPPLWSDLTKSEYQERCRKLSVEAIREALRNRKVDRPMGMKKVLRENTYKPRFTQRGTRPLCRTKCIKTLKAYQKLYFEFKARFQEVSSDLRQAIQMGLETAYIRFPEGGVPMFGSRYCLS